VAGYPGETAIIRASGPGTGGAMLDFTNVHYVHLKNLTIDAVDWAYDLTNGGSTNAIKIQDNSDHIRIEDSTIKNARGLTNPSATKGIITGGIGFNEFLNLDIFNNLGYGIYISGTNNVIDGCKFHDNNRYGIHMYNDGGGVNDNIIRNTRVYNNGDNSAGCWGGCIHPGMVVNSGSNNLIYNNLIYNNAGGGFQVAGDNTKVYNNTAYGNGSGAAGFDIQAHGADVRNNISLGNSSGQIVNGGSGNTISSNTTTGSPTSIFVNPGAADFHLQSGSPAIKAGVDLSSVFTMDFAGAKRPAGNFDVGAYAFGGSDGGGLPAPSNLRLIRTP